MVIRLLAVDDDKEVLDFVKAVFDQESGCRVETAETGRRALDLIAQEPPDLVILDWNLPDVSGYEVCRILRRDPKTAGLPILMLTAEARTARMVDALEEGADDYLVKPPHVEELRARAKALLRRKLPWLVQSQPLAFGDLRLEPKSLKAFVKGKDAGLTTMEFNLLYALAVNAGHIIQRRYLELRVLGAEDYTRALDVHLARIRAKLGAVHAKRIETAKGLGYLFNA